MRVWFVTGSTSGFAPYVVRAALSNGDRVAMIDRYPGAAREVFAERSDDLLVQQLDGTGADQAAAAVNAAVTAFGRIDVVVNIADRGVVGAVEEVSDSEARAVFDAWRDVSISADAPDAPDAQT